MAGLSEVRQEEEIDILPDRVKPLTVAEMRNLGEGKRLMSWIWFSVSEAELASDDSPEVVSSELSWSKDCSYIFLIAHGTL
jgi:hypothetical protein